MEIAGLKEFHILHFAYCIYIFLDNILERRLIMKILHKNFFPHMPRSAKKKKKKKENKKKKKVLPHLRSRVRKW